MELMFRGVRIELNTSQDNNKLWKLWAFVWPTKACDRIYIPLDSLTTFTKRDAEKKLKLISDYFILSDNDPIWDASTIIGMLFDIKHAGFGVSTMKFAVDRELKMRKK